MTRYGVRSVSPSAGAICSLGVITAAVVVSHYRLIFEGLVLSGYDIQTYFFPIRAYASKALLSGQLPLWNPHLFMGVPFLANPQSAVMYPLNLALLPLNAATALSLSVVLHVWIAAIGALVFSRKVLHLGWASGTVAALALSFGGVMSGQSGHPNQIAVIAWLPFALWLVWLISGLSPVRAAIGLSFVVAMQILSGHPQQFYMSMAICFLFLVGALLIRRNYGEISGWIQSGIRSGLFLIALALGLGLAAIQIIPSVLLSSLSTRSGGLPMAEAGSFSLPIKAVGTAIHQSFVHAPPSQEFLGFVGFTGVWLSALGFVGAKDRRRRFAIFFGILAIASLVLALGPVTPVFRLAHTIVPGFDLFRVPARWLLGVNVSLAFAAGMGLDHVLSSTGGWSPRKLTGLGMAVGTVFIVAVLTILFDETIPHSVAFYWLIAGFLSLGFLITALVGPSRLILLAPLVLGAELFLAQRPLELARPVPMEVYSNPGPVVSLLPTDLSAQRTLSIADPSYEINDAKRGLLASQYRETLGHETFQQFLVGLKYRDIFSPNLPLAYGRSSPDGYDGGILPTRDFSLFKDTILDSIGLEPDGILRNQMVSLPDRKALDLLGTGYMIVDRRSDIEVDGVFFDTEIDLPVDPDSTKTVSLVQTTVLTEIALIGDVIVDKTLPRPTTVGWLDLLHSGVVVGTLPLSLGAEIRDAQFALEIGNSIVTDLSASQYISWQRLENTQVVDGIRVRSAKHVRVVIRAITTKDHAGASKSLLLSTSDPLQLVHWKDVKVYKDLNPQPRAFLVDSYVLAGDVELASKMLRSSEFDPRESVVLEVQDQVRGSSRWIFGWFGDRLVDMGVRAPRMRTGVVRSDHMAKLVDRALATPGPFPGLARFKLDEHRSTPFLGSASIRFYEAGRLRVATESSDRALLVVGEGIYPGWRARVDGVEVPLMRANMLFMAVLLPPGTHEVTFSYEPVGFVVGVVVSLLSLIVVLGAVIVLVANLSWGAKQV